MGGNVPAVALYPRKYIRPWFSISPVRRMKRVGRMSESARCWPASPGDLPVCLDGLPRDLVVSLWSPGALLVAFPVPWPQLRAELRLFWGLLIIIIV